jgi:dTMP kinase
MTEAGILISLEGPDGAGKTTQIELLSARASHAGFKTLKTREPGGTPLGDDVRAILLNPRYQEMKPLTEVFLYAAARAQLFGQVIEPALSRGELVLCDRFIDSSLAYQAYGGGIDFDFVLQLNMEAIKGRLPDHTFILDLPPQRGLTRRPAATADRVEQKPLGFHNLVRSGFLALCEQFPSRITVIDATLPIESVSAQIWDVVVPVLRRHVGKNGFVV